MTTVAPSTLEHLEPGCERRAGDLGEVSMGASSAARVAALESGRGRTESEVVV